MNCERIQSTLLDLEAGQLSPDDVRGVQEHLKSCPACQREWSGLQDTLRKLDQLPAEAPSPRLRVQFYAMLDAHRREAETASPFGASRSRTDRWLQALWPRRPVWQFSACAALLAIGVFAGATWGAARLDNTDTSARLASTQRELAALRAKVESMDQLVTYSLASQQPAQTRLQQVVSALDQNGSNDQALAQLLNALAFDPSTNVRLSALEALYARADDRAVRQGVLAALGRESSPLVQVAMIDFLASVHDAEATPTLERLARMPTTNETVRTAAQRALAYL